MVRDDWSVGYATDSLVWSGGNSKHNCQGRCGRWVDGAHHFIAIIKCCSASSTPVLGVASPAFGVEEQVR